MDDNVYVCADCFEYMAQIPDKSVNLVFTDPPYKIVRTQGGGIAVAGNFLKSQSKLVAAGITSSYDISAMAREVKRLQPSINAYFWCNKAQIMEYLAAYVTDLRCKFDILTWHKTDAQGMFHGKYLSDTEYLLHFYRGKGTTFPQCYDDARTWLVAPTDRRRRSLGHPTVKPLDFTRKIVRNSSRPGDLVLDPFLGSGTTGIAAALEGRRFLGIEIDRGFFDIAVKRFNDEVPELFRG